MQLSKKQAGVFKGMALAMLISIIVISLAIFLDPFHYSTIDQLSQKLTVLGLSLILPTLFLLVSIGRLAKFRFFSPEDIDGSGLTSATSEATVLQSLLQNTLEQIVITYGVYTAWCLLMLKRLGYQLYLCVQCYSLLGVYSFLEVIAKVLQQERLVLH